MKNFYDAATHRFVSKFWRFERTLAFGRRRCLAAAFRSGLAPRIGDARNHAALCQQVLVLRAIARCCASCYSRLSFATKLNDRAPRLSCRVDDNDDEGRRRCHAALCRPVRVELRQRSLLGDAAVRGSRSLRRKKNARLAAERPRAPIILSSRP